MNPAQLRRLRASYALSYAGNPRSYASYAKSFARAYMRAFIFHPLFTNKYSQIKFCKSWEVTRNRVTHVTARFLGVTLGVTCVTTSSFARFYYE